MGDFLSNLMSIFQNGIIYAILVLGIFISFRILDMADMSVEGTFPLGGAISCMLIVAGVNPFLSLLVAFAGGILGGLLTGILHTKFKIPVLLSGIITMTAFFSINLRIQKDMTNISLMNGGKYLTTIYTLLGDLLNNRKLGIILVSALVLLALVIILYFLFGTNLGVAIRATGKNQNMANASGIKTGFMICIALALSNGLISLAGGMFAQSMLTSDINIGKGALVIGLASIVLGEAVFGKKSFKNQLISISLGSILYWAIIQVAYQTNMIKNHPNDIKLIYALIIAIVLILPLFKPQFEKIKEKVTNKKSKERKIAKEAKRVERLNDKEIKSEIGVEPYIAISPVGMLSGDLVINNLHKSFETNNEKKHVLKGIDLTIHEGDFVTIIGGNGSGKTTFLNCVAGSLKIDEGNISVGNINITKESDVSRSKYISRVFQDPRMGTCADMTIEHNMTVALNRGHRTNLRWASSPSKRVLFRKELSLLNLGLENRLQQAAGSLSGGQRQALTLIMANLIKPQVLLLDEHTAALDPKTASKVMDATNKIVNENHITTLMITHNMKDAIKYGNRLIMLNEGKVVFDVSGKEKENLTIEDLLNKFKENKDIVFDDKLILG